jgi:hypothetical protein
LKAEILDVETKVSQSVPIPDITADHGNIVRVFGSAAMSKKDSKLVYRILLITEDSCATMLQEEVFTWQREEALASIVQVEIMDLPSSHVFDTIVEALKTEENFIQSFIHKVEAQIKQFMVTITALSS